MARGLGERVGVGSGRCSGPGCARVGEARQASARKMRSGSRKKKRGRLACAGNKRGEKWCWAGKIKEKGPVGIVRFQNFEINF